MSKLKRGGDYSIHNPFGYTDDELQEPQRTLHMDWVAANKVTTVEDDITHDFLDNLMEKAAAIEITDENIIPKNKYMREIHAGVWVDVYDVIEAFEVTDGGFQHALKKILACGKRGHKDESEDRKDILVSVKRSNEIYFFKQEEKR